jgi:hypothetical protein
MGLMNEAMTDLTGRTLRTVNSHPVPTAAQFEAAAKAEATATHWRGQVGIADQSMGGAYELANLITTFSRQAATLRAGGHVLVMALWDTRTGQLVNAGRPVQTQYGSAYPHVRDGKKEWIGAHLTDKTLTRRGYEWVGAWVPVETTAQAEEFAVLSRKAA